MSEHAKRNGHRYACQGAASPSTQAVRKRAAQPNGLALLSGAQGAVRHCYWLEDRGSSCRALLAFRAAITFDMCG